MNQPKPRRKRNPHQAAYSPALHQNPLPEVTELFGSEAKEAWARASAPTRDQDFASTEPMELRDE